MKTSLRFNVLTGVVVVLVLVGAGGAVLALHHSSGNGQTVDAVEAVIQQANDEQEQALANNDPTLMQNTATTAYYDQAVQNLQELQSNGVTAIKLVSLEWGPVSVQGTSAQATTYETWQTTYSDSSVEQDRDENVYSLVWQNGGWKIQSDVQPATGVDQPQASASASPSPTTPPSVVQPGASESTDWSGYAATGSTFTSVSGTWTLPDTDGTSGAGDATWVGIGGVKTHDLIQTGTNATVLAPGHVRYTAWIETLPQASHPVPFSAGPGDSVTVSLTRQSGDEWLIALENHTTGQQYQTSVSYTSSLSSAEWVEEAPTAGRREETLDQFGSVQFQNATTVMDGKQVSIAQADAEPITMVGSTGQPIATPSALGGDGSSFSVTRLTSSSSAPSPAIPGSGRSTP